MITNKRQFKCGDELDFQELCNEQLEKGVKAFVVSFENDDGHKRSSALFLHRSLLDGKRRSDNLSVCNEYVTMQWGHDVLPHAIDGYLSLVHHAKNPMRLQGWVWRPSFTDSLDRLVSEVEALINFKRITATVYDLDGNQQKESTPYRTGDHVINKLTREKYRINGESINYYGETVYQLYGGDNTYVALYVTREELDKDFFKPCDLSGAIPTPKYEVGDRFVRKEWDHHVFTVTRINKVADGFVYIDETATNSAHFSEWVLDNDYAKVRME